MEKKLMSQLLDIIEALGWDVILTCDGEGEKAMVECMIVGKRDKIQKLSKELENKGWNKN